MKVPTKILLLLLAMQFNACSYRNYVMFSHDDDFIAAQLNAQARSLETNYTIQPNDLLNIRVYTKNGEMIIDPEYELNKNSNNTSNTRPNPEYLVKLDGMAYLPMIGDIELKGLTIHQANIKLIEFYSEYFVDPYVITNYTNKRVTVLGSPGGQILPLTNENITVAEVIALAGGLYNDGNAKKITLVRGNDVYLIDFSTVKGFYESNQIVKAGDIIYIEPIKRLISDNANSVALILSTITTATALLLLFTR